MSLDRVRQKYPEFAGLSDKELADSLYKSHYSNIPKQEYYTRLGLSSKDSSSTGSKGLYGVAEDISDSLSGLPSAALNLISNLPSQATSSGKQILTDPVRAIINLGGGVRKGIEGGVNIPSHVASYLKSKDIGLGKFEDFIQKIHLPESNYEEKLLGKPEEGDELLSAIGSMMPYSRIGSAAKGLEGVLKKGTAGAAYGAGQNQDPLQTALLNIVGNKLIKSGASNLKNFPKGIVNLVKNIPEIAGNTSASALETAADMTSQIPMVGKAISPVVQPTIGALASYLKHISVAPDDLAKRNLFGDIEPSDIAGMLERDAAGKRLGLTFTTPSELMESPFESVKQANIGRTTKGMKLLYKLGKERESSEASAINKLFDLIHEDKLDPIKKAAYEKTMQNSVPDDFLEKHMARPVIQKAMKSVENNTAYKQMLQEEYGVDPENVSKNTFMYWDMVKRVLGDMEQKLSRKGSNTEASVYANTRRSMVDDMDKIEPQYKIARNIAERKFTREELENVFDKKDKTFNNFDSFLKSKENFDNMMKKLDAFPEAKQQLKDIKTFSGNMIPNNPTVRAAAALKRTGMSDARNQLEAKKRELDEKYGTEHDIAAVKLMTNPNLMKILTEYLKNQKGSP